MLPPKHPGALAISIQELEFSTDLVGDSPETQLQLLVPSLRIMFIDELPGSGIMQPSLDRVPQSLWGYEKWRVREIIVMFLSRR